MAHHPKTSSSTDSGQPSSEPLSETTQPVASRSEGPTNSLARLLEFGGHIAGTWKQIIPVQQVTQQVLSWFSVSEAQLAEILERVRTELPTTEVLLIGKPQSGKSSIVRGLTGVSADIIGQGFRPHTQHTQRYNYPTDELPLFVFTDTVGLGDVTQETPEIIQELTGELQLPSAHRARIILLTVKINDFATDTLRQVASQIRQQHPEVPCLLVVTSLHEVYPAEMANHSAYPPDAAEVQRVYQAIQNSLAGLYEQAVMIDFTLEEDGYHPVFYGQNAFITALAELLPEAEARAIHQLLEEGAGQQISSLYREAGRRYILPFAIMAATLAAVPLPFATMPVLTALQISMVGLLGQLYGKTLTPSQAGGIVSAIAGGFLAQAIGRELVKFLPVFGSVIAASWAAAYTWSLGETACVYFGDLMGGKTPDPKRIQSVMKESFAAAKERFKQIDKNVDKDSAE